MTDDNGRTPHVTDGGVCWCRPYMRRICSECAADPARQPCWQCKDVGTILYAPLPCENSVPGVIVVHNEYTTEGFHD